MEKSWVQGAIGDAAGFLQSGVRKRSFGVESKTFEVETEKKKGITQIFIVERKRGVSSWIKLGPASLGPLMEGLVFCTKDTRTGHWEKFWQENGKPSLNARRNKGDASYAWVLSIGKRKDLVSLYLEAEEQKGVGPSGGGLREMESASDRQVRQKDKEKLWKP
ncbi:hypothetical protein CK203_092839 [Vitis vinifera]|uniref:Uncharacterized protein n=1 Tax=Vitis vinifera TaxID=29760 RepID=A0A438DFH2_VITVI|nr:hypothetical protein CK203_092839 [Vitis vinifera]